MAEKAVKAVEDAEKGLNEAQKMNINAKIAQLKEGMAWFDSDDFKLEEASARYKELAGLAKEIEQDLDSLKNEISVIAEDFSR